MRALAYRIEKIITIIGKTTSWLLAILLVAIMAQVFMRYALDITSTALEDSLWYLFAATLVFGLSFTMADDGHVRVDFLYQRYSKKTKKIVDLVGIVLFLIPMYAFLFWHGWEFTANSYRIAESSPNPGGLSYVWIVKGMLPVSCFLLIVESLARIVIIITEKNEEAAPVRYGS